MTRSTPLAFLLLGLAACTDPLEPPPAEPLPLHVQGEVLSTAPPGVPLDGDDRLLPIVPGSTETLWLYEIDPVDGVRTVDLTAIDYPDGLIDVIERAGNHATIRAGDERTAGLIGLEAADGRQLEVLLRVVPAVVARAVPGGAWTAGDELLASQRFAVWSGGRVSVALFAAADDADFRVIDQQLVPVSPGLSIAGPWDEFLVETPSGRQSFEVLSNGERLGFEVEVVDAIDSLEILPGTPQVGGGVNPEPVQVCVRARRLGAIVTGMFPEFTLEGAGEMIRWPNVPANCAAVAMRAGAGGGMLRATMGGRTVLAGIPSR